MGSQEILITIKQNQVTNLVQAFQNRTLIRFKQVGIICSSNTWVKYNNN